jgi:hypothetical protein
MRSQAFGPAEYILLMLFFGSFSFLLGIVFQIWIAYRSSRKFNFKLISLLLVTRVLTIGSGLLLWFSGIVPIPVTALIPELIWSPILLKAFGYHFSKRKEANP